MSRSIDKRSVLVNPIIARSVDEDHRAATPLELFYDLIYVVAIASLAAQLHHAFSDLHHPWQALGLYAFIFWCIWWPWNTYTWFASGYDTDDAQFRLASFAQMVGVIIIAVGVTPAFKDSNFFVMMIGYVTMRIPYVLAWLKVAYDDQQSRPVALRYAIGVTLAQFGWTISVLYFQNWYVFGALVAIEMAIPYLADSSVDKGQNTKYHCEHIEERLGLLTIIVLGESILAAVMVFGKAAEHFSPELAATCGGSLMIIFSMWWLYFDDRVDDQLQSETKAFLWGYGHYFVYAAATAVGALIAVQIDVATDHAEISLRLASLALSVAIALYLVSVWLCHDFILNKTGIERYELLILAAIIVGIAAATQSILLIGLAFVTLNAIRLTRKHQQHKTRYLPV